MDYTWRDDDLVLDATFAAMVDGTGVSYLAALAVSADCRYPEAFGSFDVLALGNLYLAPERVVRRTYD